MNTTETEFTGLVEGLNASGRSYMTVQGRRVYLDGFLPGDKVKVTIVGSLAEKFSVKAVGLVEPSSCRVKPDCFFYGPCGGCDLLELSEKGRKKEKQAMIKRCLADIQGGDDAEVLPFASSHEIIHYMPRVRLHQSRSYEERSSGFLASKNFAEKIPGGVVPVTSCALLVPALSRRLTAARKMLDQMPICLESFTMMASSSLKADRVVGHCVLMKGKTCEHFRKDLLKLMRTANLKGMTVANSEGKIKEVFEDPTVSGLIAPGADGGPYDSEAAFFVQGNIHQNPVLVNKVVEFCEPAEGKRIIEGFAGAGNFSLALGAKGAAVEAVESHPGAVRAGIKNIHKGNLTEKVRLYEGDALKKLTEFKPNPDVLLLDPPRTGMPGIGKIASKLGPKKIVAVFCDLDSAVKDSNAVIHSGYRLSRAQGVDLYPRTHHVELICEFEHL